MPAQPAPNAAAPPAIDPVAEQCLRDAGYATVVIRDVVETTMEEARRIAADPAAALPVVVVADRQTTGHGRRGAGWWQAPGSLAASLVVTTRPAGRPLDAAPPDATPPGPQPIWSLACGVAVAETLAALVPGIDVQLRWPNDVEVGGRKLAGILVEATTTGRAIFGIGANTSGRGADAPEPLRRRVVTIPDLVGTPLDRSRLLAALLPRLEELLAAPAAVVDRYRPRCSLTGTAVVVHAGGAEQVGICRGIDADGALVLETPGGSRRFLSGSLTPPAAIWRHES